MVDFRLKKSNPTVYGTTKTKETETELVEIIFVFMASPQKGVDPNDVRNSLESTMPWIGMYIAAASAVCILAMAADALNGFRSKKYWLPCKYFSLNALSLTLLAVAMKLPIDLTSLDLSSNDKLAKISSLVLMSIALSNFMTSLGSMENTEIVLNMAALGILVITIAGNICIHLVQMRSFRSLLYVLLPQQVTSAVIMLLFLVMLCCISLMVPGAKRYIGLKYKRNHESVLKTQVEWGRFSSVELENMVKAYWVMAQTSSPQFVLARSAVSSISGLLCLLTALVLVEGVYNCSRLDTKDINYTSNCVPILSILYVNSDYGWSINWILLIQCIGVAMGTIAPLLRWFTALWFKISGMEKKSLREELKVDKYWTWMLVEWRDRSLPVKVQNRVCKKLLRVGIRLFLNLCIGVQILFVSASNLVLFLSAISGSAVFFCFGKRRRPVLLPGSEPREAAQEDFSGYVLLLEGEPQLPSKILKNICNEADKLIQLGEKKQPQNLIQLLEKSASFSGVGRFDSCQVPPIRLQKPPNCWSLAVVTLTAISVVFLNIADDKANELLVCVSEGLAIVKLIEETLDRTGELESIRNAADMVWDEVELYRKWDGKDLRSMRERESDTHKVILAQLSSTAKSTVVNFMNETRDILMQDHRNWTARVIAANSMYRISETILLQIRGGDTNHQAEDELFDIISIIISNILAACLTNLVQVIKLKCHTYDVKEREESVRRAAILLGKSKKILEILQERELPSLDVEKAANIDEWKASMTQDIENPLPSASASSSVNATIVL